MLLKMSSDNTKIAMAAVAVASSLVIANIYHSAEKKRRSLSNERTSFDFHGVDLTGFLNAATSSLSGKQSSPVDGKQSPCRGLLELIPTEESQVTEVQSETVQVQNSEIVQDIPAYLTEEQSSVEESNIVHEQLAASFEAQEEVVIAQEEEHIVVTVEEEDAVIFESTEVEEEETNGEDDSETVEVIEETVERADEEVVEEVVEESRVLQEVSNVEENYTTSESYIIKMDIKEVVTETPEVDAATVDVTDQESSVVISADLSQWEKIVTILLGTTSFFQKTVLVVALLVMFVHNTIG